MKNLIKKITFALGLSSFAIAVNAAELVVIVNPANPATSMTSAQASQFFLGKSPMFTPVDQAESSPLRAEFYKKICDKDPSEVKAIWSKLVFTGKASAPKEYHSNAEVKKAIAANPTGIGYIEVSAVDSSVKVITALH